MGAIQVMVRAFAFSIALMVAFAPGGGAIAGATPAAETSVDSRPARVVPGQATPAETASYASRDEKAPRKLAAFSGGERGLLIIGSSTLVIILLVVLIVVLI